MSSSIVASQPRSAGGGDSAATGTQTAQDNAPIPGGSEASILPRIVALLTPFFAIAAGAFASWIGKTTGVVVDQGQITVLMTVAATAALAAAWKWMQGWQQHERLVAMGQDVPRTPGRRAPAREGNA